MDQQTSCKTLFGVHLTMHLMLPKLGLATTIAQLALVFIMDVCVSMLLSVHVYIHVCLHTLQALEGLLEGMNPPPSDPDLFVSFRDCHLLILKMVQGHSGLGPETAMYHVTR